MGSQQMVKYIGKKLISVVLMLLIVSAFTFMIIHLTPGDPARVMLGVDAPEEQVEQLREQMGLNRPMLCNRPLGWRASRVPAALTRAFTLEARTEKGWELLQAEENNYQRLYIAPVGRRTDGLRLTPRATWGAKIARLFAAYVE